MAKFKAGQVVIYLDEPDLYSIESVIEFPCIGVFYSIKKINSNERPEITIEEYLTLARNNTEKENNTMANTTNKSYNYTATPEELELDKAIKEAQDEAEKKIMDIRIELSKKLEALRTEYSEKAAIKCEERQAHVWKRRYDALLKEGFSVEQAWNMTMESFKAD